MSVRNYMAFFTLLSFSGANTDLSRDMLAKAVDYMFSDMKLPEDQNLKREIKFT